MAENEGQPESSPATRLLDALGRGDLNAALLEFRPTTIVRTEDRTWSLQGEDEVLIGLGDALDLFPGLVFDSHARHIGNGQVIEEARVRDLGPLDLLDGTAGDSGGHDVGDGPEAVAPEVGAESNAGALVLDRDFGKSDTPRLNMPIRVTVQHDDRFVHEIVLSFPRALFRSALGLHVDPLDMSVSEIQSAFMASVGSGFTTYQMGSKPLPSLEWAAPPPVPPARTPEPALEAATPEPPDQQSWRPAPLLIEEDEEPRSRARVLIPLVMVLIAAIAGGAWWLGRSDTPAAADGKPHKPSNSASQNGTKSPKPTKKPSSGSPSPTKKPVATKTDKPTKILNSDLAFPKNSAVLSDAAKTAIAHIADEVRAAKLKGTIFIDGYTDNLGSAAHGLELSQDRASAVAQSLRLSLNGYTINITAFGHGEASPIASNATEAGRQKNRRVTITLPKA